MSKVGAQKFKAVLMDVFEEYSKGDQHSFQSGLILDKAARLLGIKGNVDDEQVLLTLLNDLFRVGYLSWGYNIDNPNPPFCHMTDVGRKVLENFSHDPSNPDGYIAYLKSRCNINDIAMSYLTEALLTYNSSCMKATAVMIGAASESILLENRNVLVGKITQIGGQIPGGLQDWRFKTFSDTIYGELDKQKQSIPQGLRESFQANWSAFVAQILIARNEAGHPTVIEPVTDDLVHVSLLIFPELATLNYSSIYWIGKFFQ